MSSQCRNFMFTYNNPDIGEDAFMEKLKQKLNIQYVIFQKEVGECGTPHYQGYLELKKHMRFSALLNKGLGVHWEIRKGSQKEAIDYCKKNDTAVGTPREFGEPKSQGKRSDLLEIRDKIMSHNPDVMKEIRFKHFGSYVRYNKGIEKFYEETKRDWETLGKRQEFEDAVLRPWQKRLMAEISNEPHPRKVHWFVDYEGNKGKTWMGQYLLHMKGGLLVDNMKKADFSYLYNYEKIVVFDFQRCQEDQINYGNIEAVKNGHLVSTKYQCNVKSFQTPHVVVFSNFYPDRSKLSEDRWDIHVLKEMNKSM